MYNNPNNNQMKKFAIKSTKEGKSDEVVCDYYKDITYIRVIDSEEEAQEFLDMIRESNINADEDDVIDMDTLSIISLEEGKKIYDNMKKDIDFP